MYEHPVIGSRAVVVAAEETYLPVPPTPYCTANLVSVVYAMEIETIIWKICLNRDIIKKSRSLFPRDLRTYARSFYLPLIVERDLEILKLFLISHF